MSGLGMTGRLGLTILTILYVRGLSIYNSRVLMKTVIMNNDKGVLIECGVDADVDAGDGDDPSQARVRAASQRTQLSLVLRHLRRLPEALAPESGLSPART